MGFEPFTGSFHSYLAIRPDDVVLAASNPELFDYRTSFGM